MNEGGGAPRLASALLEHVSCDGSIDVDRTDPGRIVVRCSGCGGQVTYTLGLITGDNAARIGPSPSPGVGVPATHTGDAEVPTPEVPAATGKSKEPKALRPFAVSRAPRRSSHAQKQPRSRLIGGLIACALVAVALVAFGVVGGDSTPEPAAETPAQATATPPAARPHQSGGNGATDKPRGHGNGDGGHRRRGSRTIALAGTVDVELPAGWKRIGVSADGGADFGPADGSVVLAVYFESGAGFSLDDFAARAREFVAGRRSGAQPEAATFRGNEAGFESPYPHGREYVRVLIDGDTQVLAIATVTDGAAKVRRSEALSVLHSVSGP